MKLRAEPLTFKRANELVTIWHRHHKPAVGCKFVVGVRVGSNFVGVAIVGRAVSRMVPSSTIEVTRLATDGTRNACSFLYAASARIAAEMGYKRIQTYILESEPGTSLKAAGWVFSHSTVGGDWNHSKQRAGKRRTDQPMCKKQCWVKDL